MPSGRDHTPLNRGLHWLGGWVGNMTRTHRITIRNPMPILKMNVCHPKIPAAVEAPDASWPRLLCVKSLAASQEGFHTTPMRPSSTEFRAPLVMEFFLGHVMAAAAQKAAAGMNWRA